MRILKIQLMVHFIKLTGVRHQSQTHTFVLSNLQKAFFKGFVSSNKNILDFLADLAKNIVVVEDVDKC